MRFSVRITKDLRVSASEGGVRLHVGPRIARLHVGGGRTGISTGDGPFRVYTNVDEKPEKPRQP